MPPQSPAGAPRPPRARPAPECDRNPLQHPWWFTALALVQALIGLHLIVNPGLPRSPGYLAAAVALSLSLDNAVIAASRRLEHGRWLAPLGAWRYLLHIVVTPMLLPLTVQIGQASGVALGAKAVAISWLVAVGWIAAGWWVSFRHLDLRMVPEGQVTFQKNNSRRGQPWIDLPYVLLTLVILLMGALSPEPSIRLALVSGGVTMFGSEVLAERWGRSFSNLGEMVLLVCIVDAIRQMQR